jgi:hypothetical protein
MGCCGGDSAGGRRPVFLSPTASSRARRRSPRRCAAARARSFGGACGRRRRTRAAEFCSGTRRSGPGRSLRFPQPPLQALVGRRTTEGPGGSLIAPGCASPRRGGTSRSDRGEDGGKELRLREKRAPLSRVGPPAAGPRRAARIALRGSLRLRTGVGGAALGRCLPVHRLRRALPPKPGLDLPGLPRRQRSLVDRLPRLPRGYSAHLGSQPDPARTRVRRNPDPAARESMPRPPGVRRPPSSGAAPCCR